MRAVLPSILLDPKRLGMAFALLAYLLLAMQDAAVKWLVDTVPVWQVLFVRSAIVVSGCLLIGGRTLARRARATPVRMLLLRRGIVTLTAWFSFFTAARGLPLGELVTLWFTAPVVVALLAAPLLGEHVGRSRWVAIGIGFLGTVFVAGPTGLSASPSTLLVLFGAVCWGYGLVLTRQIARAEPSMVQMLFNNAFFLAATAIGCMLTWHAADVTEVLLLLLVALLAGFGQFCLFEAAQRAPASLIAPLEYTALVWAFAIGFVVWDDVPSRGVFLGAGLIVVAGLVLVLAERTRAGVPRRA